MTRGISDILQFVEENDIKFIRLAFCDIFAYKRISPSCRRISSMPLRRESRSTLLQSRGLAM